MSIEAMKQALEKATEVMEAACIRVDELKAENESLRQAIAEAEKQVPVVWMYQDKSTHEVCFQKHMRGFVDHRATYETPLYTHPQPNVTTSDMKQEHVAKTAKQRHEWVGLTDEEVADLGRHELWIKQFIRKVEAKLKDKNGF